MIPAEKIVETLTRQFSQFIITTVTVGTHPHIQVKPQCLVQLCNFLEDEPSLKFDLLRCISAVDWPQENSIELCYELLSTQFMHAIAVKVMLERADPEVESVYTVWPAANWHEREAFDLMGIRFLNHPDARRILMPDDWTGHPLRKDYQDLAEYHGVKVTP